MTNVIPKFNTKQVLNIKIEKKKKIERTLRFQGHQKMKKREDCQFPNRAEPDQQL